MLTVWLADADEDQVVASAGAFPHLRRSARPLRWGRVLSAVTAVAALTGIDTAWKLAAVIGGHGALDAPTSIVKPLGTFAVWLIALGGVALLPSLCVPGALLVACGVGSNLFSLALWRAAPNPLSVHIAGGILHFNLADACVAGGGLLVVFSVICTPDHHFA